MHRKEIRRKKILFSQKLIVQQITLEKWEIITEFEKHKRIPKEMVFIFIPINKIK